MSPMRLVWLELLELLKGRSGVALTQFSSTLKYVCMLELAEARLCVVQHRGTVAPSYSSAVTHLVLWPFGWGGAPPPQTPNPTSLQPPPPVPVPVPQATAFA